MTYQIIINGKIIGAAASESVILKILKGIPHKEAVVRVLDESLLNWVDDSPIVIDNIAAVDFINQFKEEPAKALQSTLFPYMGTLFEETNG